jgi:nicotinamidase-related amidase
MRFLKAADLPQKPKEWSGLLGLDQAAPVLLDSPALIVTDMQKDFLLPSGLLKVWGGPAIIPNVQKLLAAFHAAGRPVFFSRHIYENPELDGGATARWWKADRHSMLLREGTWHSQLHESFKPERGDRIISKRRYSAFFGTDLELLLRTAGAKDVVITGVCTNICCEATAHDAFFRDFGVYFTVDATGATDEAAHLATLRNISISYGRLVSAGQVIEGLKTVPPLSRLSGKGGRSRRLAR